MHVLITNTIPKHKFQSLPGSATIIQMSFLTEVILFLGNQEKKARQHNGGNRPVMPFQ